MSQAEVIKKLKHDFKRPLSNLQMLVTILEAGGMEKERLVGALKKIIQEGDQALRLLDQLNENDQT